MRRSNAKSLRNIAAGGANEIIGMLRSGALGGFSAVRVPYSPAGGEVAVLVFYGTGSYPLPPQGWQRARRRKVSHPPFSGPYLRSASSAYCEQVGVNRHDGGVKGEMQSW